MIRIGSLAENEQGTLILLRREPEKGYVTLSYANGTKPDESQDCLTVPETLFDHIARQYTGLIP